MIFCEKNNTDGLCAPEQARYAVQEHSSDEKGFILRRWLPMNRSTAAGKVSRTEEKNRARLEKNRNNNMKYVKNTK